MEECGKSSDEAELSSSRLGTKEYWDENFTKDLSIYSETKDVGEIWFGEESIERVADWLDDSDQVTNDSSVLDIGCGNGMMLVELARRGYKNLFGTDYSENAVHLAKLIAEEQHLFITYEVCDILKDGSPEGSPSRQQYDVCLDKGTYDAISLNPDNSRQLQRSRYLASLQRVVKHNGLFIITSCNWTKDELLEQFKQDFCHLHTIPTPSFQFGGRTGSKETVLVLQRL